MNGEVSNTNKVEIMWILNTLFQWRKYFQAVHHVGYARLEFLEVQND